VPLLAVLAAVVQAQPRAAEIACKGMARGSACHYDAPGRLGSDDVEVAWGHCYALDHWSDGNGGVARVSDGVSAGALLCLQDGSYSFAAAGSQPAAPASSANRTSAEEAGQASQLIDWVADGGWILLAVLAGVLCIAVVVCFFAASYVFRDPGRAGLAARVSVEWAVGTAGKRRMLPRGPPMWRGGMARAARKGRRRAALGAKSAGRTPGGGPVGGAEGERCQSVIAAAEDGYDIERELREAGFADIDAEAGGSGGGGGAAGDELTSAVGEYVYLYGDEGDDAGDNAGADYDDVENDSCGAAEMTVSIRGLPDDGPGLRSRSPPRVPSSTEEPRHGARRSLDIAGMSPSRFMPLVSNADGAAYSGSHDRPIEPTPSEMDCEGGLGVEEDVGWDDFSFLESQRLQQVLGEAARASVRNARSSGNAIAARGRSGSRTLRATLPTRGFDEAGDCAAFVVSPDEDEDITPSVPMSARDLGSGCQGAASGSHTPCPYPEMSPQRTCVSAASSAHAAPSSGDKWENMDAQLSTWLEVDDENHLFDTGRRTGMTSVL